MNSMMSQMMDPFGLQRNQQRNNNQQQQHHNHHHQLSRRNNDIFNNHAMMMHQNMHPNMDDPFQLMNQMVINPFNHHQVIKSFL
jgi:hypothetical protein